MKENTEKNLMGMILHSTYEAFSIAVSIFAGFGFSLYLTEYQNVSGSGLIIGMLLATAVSTSVITTLKDYSIRKYLEEEYGDTEEENESSQNPDAVETFLIDTMQEIKTELRDVKNE